MFILILSLVACRGWKSESPPIHPNINFDFQPKVTPQTDPLPIPVNTIQYKQQTKPTKSRLSNYSVDEAFIKNGQKNYNIYCAACHTRSGNGIKSIITQNGWTVPNLLEDSVIKKTNNELLYIVNMGQRQMPGYSNKLSDEEAWQVVLYIRALQEVIKSSKTDEGAE